MDWLTFVDRLGIPVGLLAAICYALWRAAVFVATKVTDATEAHLKFVATVSEQTTRQADAAEQQTALMSSQHDILREQGRLLSEIHSHVKSPH
jgi:hypothetical protein